MIEDIDYGVTIVIRLSTRISFAPIERDRPIDKYDATANAAGLLSDEQWAEIMSGFGGEFDVDISYETEKIL
jgi:hypothetical protein